ncbi:shikimate dehydrogenase [Catenulispora sp. EB89]|uniref:shikimate dehydrogenase n=1 Tax=Catenulispora sp. EB89 TaxID=3156257 RepID=UPI003511F88E
MSEAEVVGEVSGSDSAGGVVKFVGISTGASRIHTAFPRWARVVGVEAEVVGVDVPAGASAEAYRSVLDSLREPSVLGAVITSHKVGLFAAASDAFESLDPLARQYREINSIRNDGGRLHGYARDPISVGRVIEEIWPERDGDLLCLGSGGTAIALGEYLLRRGHRGRLRFVDRDPAAVARLRAVVDSPLVGAEVGDGPFDAAVAALAPGALVVNATGAGKDRPGSPVTDAVEFPARSTVWDLNYRGDLHMLRVARSQAAARGLRVYDGLSLFCHGWAAALTTALDLPEDPGLGQKFMAALEE